MTRHRLIRTSLDRVVEGTAQLHPEALSDSQANVPAWLGPGENRAVLALSWYGLEAIGPLHCCLELQRAACGVLVHLTVVPAGSARPGSSRLLRGLLDVWAGRELAALARLVEVDTSPTGKAAA